MASTGVWNNFFFSFPQKSTCPAVQNYKTKPEECIPRRDKIMSISPVWFCFTAICYPTSCIHLLGLKTFLQYSLRELNMNTFTGVGWLRVYRRGYWFQFSTFPPTWAATSGSDLTFQEKWTFCSACFTFLLCQWVHLSQGYSAFLYEKGILICINLSIPKVGGRKLKGVRLNKNNECLSPWRKYEKTGPVGNSCLGFKDMWLFYSSHESIV